MNTECLIIMLIVSAFFHGNHCFITDAGLGERINKYVRGSIPRLET